MKRCYINLNSVQTNTDCTLFRIICFLTNIVRVTKNGDNSRDVTEFSSEYKLSSKLFVPEM